MRLVLHDIKQMYILVCFCITRSQSGHHRGHGHDWHMMRQQARAAPSSDSESDYSSSSWLPFGCHGGRGCQRAR